MINNIWQKVLSFFGLNKKKTSNETSKIVEEINIVAETNTEVPVSVKPKNAKATKPRTPKMKATTSKKK
jgi:hypothetical protein